MTVQFSPRDLVQLVENVVTQDDLAHGMAEITAHLGVQYFALAHHVDLPTVEHDAIRLHNYPAAWADYYELNALGVSDPVHRASHLTSVGFCWSRIPEMIHLTPDDRRVLALGRAQGIGDGFTVPANVPGEARGSCTFANENGRPLGAAMLPMAQLAGAFAFEAARRVWLPRGRSERRSHRPLTDRQRDCVLWAARGKSDWEMSRILGVSEETIGRHIKQALARYEVSKRTSLIIRALFDGTLTFSDILRG